jgi:hypothetical protein
VHGAPYIYSTRFLNCERRKCTEDYLEVNTKPKLDTNSKSVVTKPISPKVDPNRKLDTKFKLS